MYWDGKNSLFLPLSLIHPTQSGSPGNLLPGEFLIFQFVGGFMTYRLRQFTDSDVHRFIRTVFQPPSRAFSSLIGVRRVATLEMSPHRLMFFNDHRKPRVFLQPWSKHFFVRRMPLLNSGFFPSRKEDRHGFIGKVRFKLEENQLGEFPSLIFGRFSGKQMQEPGRPFVTPGAMSCWAGYESEWHRVLPPRK